MIDAHNILLRGPAGLVALLVLCAEQRCSGGHFVYLRAYLREGLRDHPHVEAHAKSVFKHTCVSALMAASLFFLWGVL